MVANPFPAAMQLCTASNGSSSRSNPGPDPKTSGGRIVFRLELEEAAAKEKETGNQNAREDNPIFAVLCMCATICSTVWLHIKCRHHMPIHTDMYLTR